MQRGKLKVFVHHDSPDSTTHGPETDEEIVVDRGSQEKEQDEVGMDSRKSKSLLCTT